MSETSVALALRSDPDVPKRVADVLLAGLQATTWRYDTQEKRVITEPDWKERREYARLILSYFEGLPKQTVINIDALADQRPALAEVLRKSPNARRAVQAFMDSLGSPLNDASDQQTVSGG